MVAGSYSPFELSVGRIRSSVDEFSVLADKPVVLVREFFIDLAPFINDVVAMCPQFTNELRESFLAIPRPLRDQRILLRYFWISKGHLYQDVQTQI